MTLSIGSSGSFAALLVAGVASLGTVVAFAQPPEPLFPDESFEGPVAEPAGEPVGAPGEGVEPAGYEDAEEDPVLAPDAPGEAVRMTGFLSTIDEVDLAAERPGVLRTLTVREGTRVEQDEIVGRLADEVVRAKLATAELQASDDVSERYAMRAAAVAKADLDRMTAANDRVRGVVVAADVERARLSWEQAKAQIEKARLDRNLAASQVVELQAELQTYLIAAPFPGVVQKVHRRPGSAVQQGTPVVRLINTDRLRVEAFVDFEDTLSLKVGDRAEGRALIPGRAGLNQESLRFDGRVTFIDQAEAMTTQNPTVRVFLELDNSEGRFRAGLRANVIAYPNTAATAPEESIGPQAAIPRRGLWGPAADTSVVESSIVESSVRAGAR